MNNFNSRVDDEIIAVEITVCLCWAMCVVGGGGLDVASVSWE